ncbi:hypothetical protein L345_07786, partial [Ophiophagus hannah]
MYRSKAGQGFHSNPSVLEVLKKLGWCVPSIGCRPSVGIYGYSCFAAMTPPLLYGIASLPLWDVHAIVASGCLVFEVMILARLPKASTERGLFEKTVEALLEKKPLIFPRSLPGEYLFEITLSMTGDFSSSLVTPTSHEGSQGSDQGVDCFVNHFESVIDLAVHECDQYKNMNLCQSAMPSLKECSLVSAGASYTLSAMYPGLGESYVVSPKFFLFSMYLGVGETNISNDYPFRSKKGVEGKRQEGIFLLLALMITCFGITSEINTEEKYLTPFFGFYVGCVACLLAFLLGIVSLMHPVGLFENSKQQKPKRRLMIPEDYVDYYMHSSL